jgi:hypothetical protein
LLLGLSLLAGCKNAVEGGRGTALDGVDLVQMTDQMAASLAASPAVQEAFAQRGPLKVVVQPVQNYMEAEVLPTGQADAFTARVRSLLSKSAADRFTWVMNRDAFYRLRGQELEGPEGKVVLGPLPDDIQPEYALTARFTSLTDETGKARTSSYLCTYELTSLADRRTLWGDKYEVRKTAVKRFLD